MLARSLISAMPGWQGSMKLPRTRSYVHYGFLCPSSCSKRRGVRDSSQPGARTKATQDDKAPKRLREATVVDHHSSSARKRWLRLLRAFKLHGMLGSALLAGKGGLGQLY
ncbi:hypothetical protein ACFE04_021253 [Oxalis oulophora]